MAAAFLEDQDMDASKALLSCMIREIVSSSSERASHREPAKDFANFAPPADEDCLELPALVEIDDTASSDSRRDLPPRLSFYDRAVPLAIQARSEASNVFHAICFCFELQEQGRDSLQQDATDYAILFPSEIDSSLVASFDVDLFLQDRSIVNVRAEDHDSVTLDEAQVELAQSFTKWLFDLVLGRSTDASSSATHEAKAYYVVPLLNRHGSSTTGSFGSLIDWDTLGSAISSGLRYKSAHYLPQAPASVQAVIQCADPEVDSLVAYREVPYLVVSIPTNELAKELDACKVYRAISYLSHHSDGDEVPKKLKPARLPAQECVSYNNLSGSLYRGALRLPSVLHRFEMALVAAELRDKMEVQVPSSLILEALTSGACNLSMSYERLELLGDSVLKFMVGTHVFSAYPLASGETLGMELYKVVCNKALAGLAQARDLHLYIFAQMFSPSKWSPPGRIPFKLLPRPQLLSTRTLADVVEALLGACSLEGDLMVASKAMKWLQIPLKWPQTPPDIDLSISETRLSSTDIEELQELLKYKFRDERLLVAALDQGVSDFFHERLQFLGDAVLDYVTTRYLVKAFPSLNSGQLNVLKQASVNGEHYACLCVQHSLHHHVQKVCPGEDIWTFSEALLKEIEAGNGSHQLSFGIPGQSSPKVLRDVIQTLAASIFVDSGFDVELLWKVYKPLLEPLATPENVILHPLAQLVRLCKERNLSLKTPCVEVDGIVHADMVVNEETLGRSQHEEKRVARRLAAMEALQHLRR